MRIEGSVRGGYLLSLIFERDELAELLGAGWVTFLFVQIFSRNTVREPIGMVGLCNTTIWYKGLFSDWKNAVLNCCCAEKCLFRYLENKGCEAESKPQH